MAVDMVTTTVTRILNGIVDKRFVEEQPLPPEAELARYLEVSRPTMREAVRALSLGGVLNVVHGRGTFLLPRFRWRELRYLMYVAAHEGRSVEVEVEVLGVGAMLEVGSARLAARYRTPEHLEALRRHVEEYEVAHAAGDVQALVGIDNAFHDTILGATGNTFVSSAVHPYRDALLDVRFRAAEAPAVRERISRQHREILQALESRDEERVVALMQEHMDSTREDILAARPRREDEISQTF